MNDRSERENRQSIIVEINEKEVGVPEDFGSSPDEMLESIGWEVNGVKDWCVYRKDGEKCLLTPDDECSEPMVVSEGDEFVVVPDTVTGG